jgi:hypothetical protein
MLFYEELGTQTPETKELQNIELDGAYLRASPKKV